MKNPATGAVYIVLESLLGAIPGAVPKTKKGKGKEAAPEPGFEVRPRACGSAPWTACAPSPATQESIGSWEAVRRVF